LPIQEAFTSGTLRNATAADLIDDINAAIAGAGFDGEVVASVEGDRLTLTTVRLGASAKVDVSVSGGANGLGLTDGTATGGEGAFLQHYADCLSAQTVLFPGIAELLEDLSARGIGWGIVTNKATRFTEQIVAALGLSPGCVVCGDTTPHAKPHPAPLLHAAQVLSLAPSSCWYVGDDLRDVQAAQAAGMRSIAVAYGYHGVENGGPHSWNADAVIAHPLDLLAQIER